jgi:hypothetical protein
VVVVVQWHGLPAIACEKTNGQCRTFIASHNSDGNCG